MDRAAVSPIVAVGQFGGNPGPFFADVVGLLLKLDATAIAGGRNRAGQLGMERVHEVLAQCLMLRFVVVA